MARYSISGWGYPISGGAVLIPPGTILDSASWSFNGVPLPAPPPSNAVCLDADAYNTMLKYYPAYSIQIGY
jgi:hypothetical protein